MPDPRTHWNDVWTEKDFTETSWYQADPTPSLTWIERVVAAGGSADRVVDAGCGVSFLTDRLLDRGSEVVGVDVASAAIQRLQSRVAGRSVEQMGRFRGIACDLGAEDPDPAMPIDATIWHDRAVLHFLQAEARERYAENARRHLVVGGHAIIAGFAADGPLKCSGLEVVRASADEITTLLGSGFTLVGAAVEPHRTPWDADQAFQWTCLRRDT